MKIGFDVMRSSWTRSVRSFFDPKPITAASLRFAHLLASAFVTGKGRDCKEYMRRSTTHSDNTSNAEAHPGRSQLMDSSRVGSSAYLALL